MKLYVVLFALLLAAACSKKSEISLDANQGDQLTTETVYPPCVQDVINNGSTDWIRIYQYNWDGKTVYLFVAGCCDFFDVIYDSNCNVICAPSGGLTGGGDGRCPDFYDEAKLVKLVWKRR